MRILFILVLLLSSFLSFSQSTVVKDTAQEQIFEQVEVEASVDANLWRQHLQHELQPILEKAARSGIKAGKYTINVRFLVEKDGSISDVKAMNNPGHGLAKGAENVVRTGPKWTPGIHKGNKVRSYHTQPISFVIEEE